MEWVGDEFLLDSRSVFGDVLVVVVFAAAAATATALPPRHQTRSSGDGCLCLFIPKWTGVAWSVRGVVFTMEMLGSQLAVVARTRFTGRESSAGARPRCGADKGTKGSAASGG